MPKHMNKHRITLDEAASVRHMRGAAVSHFALIEGVPFIWVEEHDGIVTRRVTYRVFQTGEDIPDYYQYVASAQDPITGISAHLYKES